VIGLFHRVLISTPLSASQKACETNPGREQKYAAVFAILTLAEENHLHSMPRSHGGEHNKSKSRTKKSLLYITFKNLYAGPKKARNILANISPNAARNLARKPVGLTSLPNNR